ncbi:MULTISPECIES: hypothetical protein [Enterobacteriaceae]|uniref:hypothetical protein n=1 Tax=Enterobacteriaceae TaxID=543 RepID=UPI001E4ACBD0|nr:MULTISPECIES: hypothetical protein [Enterobacteriaceae]
MRKVRRHRENLGEFYSSLQELGGILRIDDVADILGITHHAVNVRVKKHQLIAFKLYADFIFPVFRFIDNGLLPGFDEILEAFDEDIHPILHLTLLKTPISIGKGGMKTPIQIMQDGAIPDELSLAIRAVKNS